MEVRYFHGSTAWKFEAGTQTARSLKIPPKLKYAINRLTSKEYKQVHGVFKYTRKLPGLYIMIIDLYSIFANL